MAENKTKDWYSWRLGKDLMKEIRSGFAYSPDFIFGDNGYTIHVDRGLALIVHQELEDLLYRDTHETYGDTTLTFFGDSDSSL